MRWDMRWEGIALPRKASLRLSLGCRAAGYVCLKWPGSSFALRNALSLCGRVRTAIVAGMRRLILWLMLLCVPGCYADVPCPLKLIDGSLQQDGLRVTFRNTGKLAIQQLDISCRPLDGKSRRSASCRTETGLFYPGQQYDLDFQYGGAHKAVVLSLESARLSDGSEWRVGPHQACKSLKVLRSKKP